MTDVRPATTAHLDDFELLRRVGAGDTDSFSALYDRFAARAGTVARAIVHDRSTSDDVVQDAFLSLWRSREAYRPELGTPAGWVLTAVRHRAIDTLRRERRHERHRSSADEALERLPAAGHLEDAATERDAAARLRSLLDRLPREQRDVITLAYFGELSGSEIADRLGIPIGTVKGRMRLGLTKLRAALAEPDGRLLI